jgi:hypothetical protein
VRLISQALYVFQDERLRSCLGHDSSIVIQEGGVRVAALSLLGYPESGLAEGGAWRATDHERSVTSRQPARSQQLSGSYRPDVRAQCRYIREVKLEGLQSVFIVICGYSDTSGWGRSWTLREGTTRSLNGQVKTASPRKEAYDWKTLVHLLVLPSVMCTVEVGYDRSCHATRSGESMIGDSSLA